MANRDFDQLRKDVGESIGIPSSTGRGARIAGLAINEEIDSQNRRPWWVLIALAEFTLTTTGQTYTLSTSWPNFKTHVASILMNAANTAKEADIPYYPLDDFFRAGYTPTPHTGVPRLITADTFNDLIRIDTIPGSGLNGRTVRTLYYRKLSRLSVSTATLGCDDSLEDVIVQGAKWRAMRLAKLDGWEAEREVAKDAQREMLATPPSVDLAALGFR